MPTSLSALLDPSRVKAIIAAQTRPISQPTASQRGQDLTRARVGAGPIGSLPAESARYFQSIPFKFAQMTNLPSTRARPQLTSIIGGSGRAAGLATRTASLAGGYGPVVNAPARAAVASSPASGDPFAIGQHPMISFKIDKQIAKALRAFSVGSFAKLAGLFGIEALSGLLGVGVKELVTWYFYKSTRGGRRRRNRGITYRQLSNAKRVMGVLQRMSSYMHSGYHPRRRSHDGMAYVRSFRGKKKR